MATQSDTYGTRLAINSSKAGVGSVTAQYCLDASNCNGVNLVTLSMTSISGINWTTTDNTGNTITLNTVLTPTGTLSTGGYHNAGNYTYDVGSISSSHAGQFIGTEVNGGTLTIDKLSITPTANAISRVYDATNLVAGMALIQPMYKAWRLLI